MNLTQSSPHRKLSLFFGALTLLLTFWFLWQELVVSGILILKQQGGVATSLIGSPWPKERLGAPVRDGRLWILPIVGESIFIPVELPRSFETMRVELRLRSTMTLEGTRLGVQRRPATFDYLTHPAAIKRDGASFLLSAQLPLKTIDQRRHRTNIVLILPQKPNEDAVQLETVRVTLQRTLWELPRLQTLRERLRL